MTDLLLLLNVAMLALPSAKTNAVQNANSNSFDNELISVKGNTLYWNENERDSCNKIEDKTKTDGKDKGNENDGSVSDSILNIEEYLNNNFDEFDRVRDYELCGITSDVTNSTPIEMQSANFPRSDIDEAIKIAGVENETSYGGCGAIAALGIMDYFARYLGYEEIIDKPNESESRVKIAAEVLSNTKFHGDKDNTLIRPWDYNNCFNTIMSNHGLSDVINSTCQRTLVGGEQKNYWDQIIQNIDKGLPVTLCTGMACGNGNFSRHYTNIYGYETWNGISKSDKNIITKKFIKAHLNWGRYNGYYCDADILNCGQIGIITYNINYLNTYSFYAKDFAEEFVNETGTGQYFFYNISQKVSLSDGKIVETNRLRTSYIENEYLVLSPNRKNAGKAYLDITFPNSISKFSFSASLWSGIEGEINENFKVQYYSNGWKDYIEINLNTISSFKNRPDYFVILFPKNSNRIRFFATHSKPSGDRNKGRICLDNFVVEYN